MNIFQFSACNEKYFEDILADCGKERKTTFFSDLSIADWYGEKSIRDTYRNVCKSWIDNAEYFTEFILCLNHKAWLYSNIINKRINFSNGSELENIFKRLPMEKYQTLYSDLYYKAIEVAEKAWNSEDLAYLYEMID